LYIELPNQFSNEIGRDDLSTERLLKRDNGSSCCLAKINIEILKFSFQRNVRDGGAE
jgi:hypothetical protein